MQIGEKVDRVAFGLFEADLHSGELWKAGHRIKLPRQPFRVLAALLAQPGDIVTREGLQHEIWGANTNVDFDQAIAAAINKIREALGDSAENPRFIQTLTKRGYRFIAPVTPIFAKASHQPSEPSLEVISDFPIKALNEAIGTELEVAQAQPVQRLPVAAKTPLEITNSFDRSRDAQGREEDLSFAAVRPSTLWNRAGLIRICLLGMALVASALSGRWFWAPASRGKPYRVDQVTHYVPISLGPPNPESFLTMAIDGNRILTSVMVNGRPPPVCYRRRHRRGSGYCTSRRDFVQFLDGRFRRTARDSCCAVSNRPNPSSRSGLFLPLAAADAKSRVCSRMMPPGCRMAPASSTPPATT